MNESREHILLTALQLFSQKNFKAVTMKEIVDKTGMSKGAFYHYFESKEQVFTEVINHFFLDLITENYDDFSQESLQQFYLDILSKEEKKRKASNKKNGVSDNNYYHLIFDAMHMLPDFKKKHAEQQKQEIKAWKNIITIAKNTGEIATQLGDEQVAKLFIYLSDGVNINLVVNNDLKKHNELRTAWDGLYTTLKAK